MTISNNFVPNRQIIEAITNSNPAVVTTTAPHGYDNTLSVRIVFPQPSHFGMEQLNNQVFQITVIDNSDFSIPIDTTSFDPFNGSGAVQSPQTIPVGEVGYTFSESTRNNNNIIPET